MASSRLRTGLPISADSRQQAPVGVLPNCPERGQNWKIALRYGTATTRYKHFTIVAEGWVQAQVPEPDCPPGTAFMGMKAWAASPDEAAALARAIGMKMGFKVTGRVDVYSSAPMEPPGDDPRAYDVIFGR